VKLKLKRQLNPLNQVLNQRLKMIAATTTAMMMIKSTKKHQISRKARPRQSITKMSASRPAIKMSLLRVKGKKKSRKKLRSHNHLKKTTTRRVAMSRRSKPLPRPKAGTTRQGN
jgi:hypothetical protein